MKKYTLLILLLSFFMFPSVSHAAWWEYANDKTIISFIKSIFTKSKFVSFKYEFYDFKVPVDKTAIGNTPPTKAVSSGKNTTNNVSQQNQVTETVASEVDEPAFNVSTMSYTKSDNVLVGVDSTGTVTLKATPSAHSSWISFTVVTSKPSNYVYLDLDFTSDVISQGVFNTFFDGQDLGYMDERFFDAGTKRVVMGYPSKSAGAYTVTFRLDQFGALPSGVTIRNIGVGFFL